MALPSPDSSTETSEGPRRPAGRLRAEDWADAALAALGEGGLPAVAVEPLAAGLGATKGSFYHHFANRAALVDAALARWEAEHTDAVIDAVAREPDAAQRLRRLLRLVVGISPVDRVEMALLAHAEDPQVQPVLARVTARRVDYVASLYRDLGLTPAAAQRRALLAVSVYLGHLQLARAAPDALPGSGAQWTRHLDEMVDALLPPP